MTHNIQFFLYQIQARKRWSGCFSVNVENNDNINSGANISVINIFGIPFHFAEPREERGLSFSGGAEYQYPLADEWRWRFGTNIVRGISGE